MKDNDNSQKTFGGGRTKMLVAAGIAIVAAIVALKLLSNGPHPAPVPPATPPAATATPDILPPDSDETAAGADSLTIVAVSDTVGVDPRPPYEAGYEDGYNSGLDDGHAASHKATYDESNTFKSMESRNRYVKGYREGYAQGFKDASEGNEFNMSPPDKE